MVRVGLVGVGSKGAEKYSSKRDARACRPFGGLVTAGTVVDGAWGASKVEVDRTKVDGPAKNVMLRLDFSKSSEERVMWTDM